MRIKPLKPIIGVAAALMVAGSVAIGVPALTTQGADHLDAPLVSLDGRLDINDVYAFKKGDNTVLVMTVNPLAGVLSADTFHPIADYDFKIDNTGDAMEDITYRLNFSLPSSKSAAPSQTVTLSKIDSGGTSIIAEGKVSAPAKGGGAKPKIIPVEGGGSLFAGLRDDPFFFDLVAFQNALAGIGTLPRNPDAAINGVDFFAGSNVSAIVLEVPTAGLVSGGPDIGVWATTGTGGGQFERMGRPTINTVLIPAGSKDAFNATVPADDVADWSGDVEASLLFLSGLDGTGYSVATASLIAGVLLPDILTLDTSSGAGFLNGRKLADDVIDAVLPIATGDATALGLGSVGAVLTTDEVPANDKAFLSTFPYLAGPH